MTYADVAKIRNVLQAYIHKTIFIKQLQCPVEYVDFCMFQGNRLGEVICDIKYT